MAVKLAHLQAVQWQGYSRSIGCKYLHRCRSIGKCGALVILRVMAIVHGHKGRAAGMLTLPRSVLHLPRTARAGLRTRKAHHLAGNRCPCSRQQQDDGDHSEKETLLHTSILHLSEHWMRRKGFRFRLHRLLLVLMHGNLSAARGRIVFSQHEGQRHHEDRYPAEQVKNVHISQRLRLL